MYSRILVAIEHSKADEAILEHIVKLARMTGARLLLVHVADGWAARHFEDLNLRESEEIRFDIVYSAVSERTRRAFTVLTGIALIALYGISLPAAYKYVTFMKVERSAYLQIPINWLYGVFLIFSVACICRYFWLTYRAIKGAKPPETDPAQLPE